MDLIDDVRQARVVRAMIKKSMRSAELGPKKRRRSWRSWVPIISRAIFRPGPSMVVGVVGCAMVVAAIALYEIDRTFAGGVVAAFSASIGVWLMVKGEKAHYD